MTIESMNATFAEVEAPTSIPSAGASANADFTDEAFLEALQSGVTPDVVDGFSLGCSGSLPSSTSCSTPSCTA
jgi:hypothetical protein